VRPSDLFDYLDWQGAARRPVTAKVVAIGEGDRRWQHFRRISPVGFLALWADVDPDAPVAYLEIENVDDYGYAGSLLAEIRVRLTSQYLVDVPARTEATYRPAPSEEDLEVFDRLVKRLMATGPQDPDA